MSLQIKRVIKEKGLSINEVAEIMGISRIGLSQHINGNPSVEVLERIAKALGVQVAELFEGYENKSTDTEKTIGIVRHGNKSYEINSIRDIENLLEIIKGDKS